MTIEIERNSYAAQKLGQALDSLVGEGPLRRRLTYAAHPLITLRSVPTGGSAAIAERVSLIVDELTKEPLDIKGYPVARSTISPKRAKLMAKEILALYTEALGGPDSAAERDPL